MNNFNDKIKSFTDLNTWKEGHKLSMGIYSITERFPKSEQFSLTDQMRRAAVSITSNIAEGFSRSTHKEKNHFYSIARGSLTEIQNQLILSRDLRYIPDSEFQKLWEQTIIVHKLLGGLMRGAFNLQSNST